jgi:tetratricopeptide (TPR) repeat protein
MSIDKGKEHLKNGEWDDAIANFSLAIDLAVIDQNDQNKAERAEAYLGRAKARCFQNSKEHDEGYYGDAIDDASTAIAYYESIKTKTDKAKAKLIRAYAYYLSGDYKSAAADCDKITETDPITALVQELLGNIHYKKKAYSEAKKCYAAAIADLLGADPLKIPGLNLLEKYREACKQQKLADR